MSHEAGGASHLGDFVESILRDALSQLETRGRSGEQEPAARERLPRLTQSAIQIATRYLTIFTLECLERSIVEAEIDAQVKCSSVKGADGGKSPANGETEETVRDSDEALCLVSVQPEHVLRTVPQLLLDF
jgi:hypothetical protein